MRTSSGLLGLGIGLGLLLGTSELSAQRYGPNGDVCQRASSGYVICRDPRDRYSQGYVVGGRPRPDRDAYRGGGYYGGGDRRGYGGGGRGYYNEGGQVCQRASSGYIICRDPRDRRSQGYVVGR